MHDCYAEWLQQYGKYILAPIGRILFRHSFHVPTAKRTQNYPSTLITWDLISVRPRNRTPDLYACQRITRTVPRQRHVQWQLICTLSTILPTGTSRRFMAIDSRASIDHYLDDNTEGPDRRQEEKEEKEVSFHRVGACVAWSHDFHLVTIYRMESCSGLITHLNDLQVRGPRCYYIAPTDAPN